MVSIYHTTEFGGSGAVIVIEGPLTGESAADLESYAGTLMNGGVRAVLIDGSGMEYIASSGIGAILVIGRKLGDTGGALALCSLNTETSTLFSLLGFGKEFIITPSKSEGLRELRRLIDLSVTEKARAREPVQGAAKPGTDDSGMIIAPVASHAPSAPVPAQVETVSAPEPAPAAASFQHPVIVECRECGSLVRVKKSGDYRCPECDVEFTVFNDMSVAM